MADAAIVVLGVALMLYAGRPGGLDADGAASPRALVVARHRPDDWPRDRCYRRTVILVVPYLQALGLPRDQLIQALGLSLTVSTVPWR
jgi:hypothetical protein